MGALVVVGATGAGAVGGVFLAFSSVVLPALSRLPAPQGISAMQSVNVTAVRPAFLSALFGTGAVCVALGVQVVRQWGERGALLVLLGSAAYLAGAVVLTVMHHVPLNDTLAAVDPSAPGADGPWQHYLRSWGWANHARTALCLAGAALLSSSLVTSSPAVGDDRASTSPAKASVTNIVVSR